jgi:integrase
MPRPSKGPRLYLKSGYSDRQPLWIIRDGQREIGTGCPFDARVEAERKLAEYILEKHTPKRDSSGDLASIKVADALSVYMTEKIAATARPKAGIAMVQNLNKFFGARSIAELNGKLCRQYAAKRGSQTSARRELEVLQAAVNYYVKDEVGGVQTKFRAVLPDAPPARDRWLTRDEAAKLIMAAWRMREKRGEKYGRHTGRHIARFILVGLYTGTRVSAICGAALTRAIGRGYVDLENGIFVRKALGARENNKRQPSIPIPPRLLAHMRRWKRLRISNHSVIEWNGRPVLRISKGWRNVRTAAGLDKAVIPHTLRHTSITWYLRSGKRPEQVSDYAGVSLHIIKKHYKHHMPGGFDDVMASSARLGRA